MRAFASLSCWNEFPVELRDLPVQLSVGPETFVKHLKMHMFRVGFFLMEHALSSSSDIL